MLVVVIFCLHVMSAFALAWCLSRRAGRDEGFRDLAKRVSSASRIHHVCGPRLAMMHQEVVRIIRLLDSHHVEP